MGEYLTRDERLRRIGDLLLKGVYLWAEATRDGDTAGSGDPDRCPSGPDLLEDLAARFDDLFQTVAQRRSFRTYLRGLLSPRERSKTLAALAGTALAATKSAASIQRLQYFLCESAWDAKAVAARRLALLRANSATCPHGAGVLVLEAGVDAGEGGGAAPAPVCSLWAEELVCYPLHLRPVSPAGRRSEPADRTAADDRTDAVAALVEAARAAGIAFRAVVGECAPGDRARIEEALRAISVSYVLAHLPTGGPTAPSDTASRSTGNGQVCCRSPAAAAGKWVPVVRCFEDGHEETWWATEHHARPDELEDATRGHPDRRSDGPAGRRHLASDNEPAAAGLAARQCHVPKYAVRPLDFAIVGVAVRVVVGPAGRIEEVRIGLNGAADRPLRAVEAEATLAGQVPSRELLVEAAETAARHSHPLDEVDGSAAYRRRCVAVYTRRALERALSMEAG